MLLLVDDDRASLDLVAAYLDGSGVDIVRARDGAEALEQARRLRPGRGRPRHPAAQARRVGGARGPQVPTRSTADIPVVVVSIVDEPSRGRSLGAAGYLTKPVRRESLLTALRTAGVPLSPVDRPAALPDEVAP